jgi:hypothetical protein
LFRPLHLREQIAAVQETDTVLALMNLRPDVRSAPFQSIATNIIIPAVADAVVLDGKPVAVDKPFELPVTPESTVVVRVGAGAAVARIFAADGIAGQKPSMFLKFDGNTLGMARLVAYHYRAPSGQPRPPPDETVRAGVIMLAGKCGTPNDANALLARAAAIKIEHSVNANVWNAKLVDGQTTLEAGLDLQNGNVVTRRVNGKDYEPKVFTVNDKDLALEYLGL